MRLDLPILGRILRLQLQVLQTDLLLRSTPPHVPTTVIACPSSGSVPLVNSAGFSSSASPTITPLTPVSAMHRSASARHATPPFANTGMRRWLRSVRIAAQSQLPTRSLFCSRVRPWIYALPRERGRTVMSCAPSRSSIRHSFSVSSIFGRRRIFAVNGTLTSSLFSAFAMLSMRS